MRKSIVSVLALAAVALVALLVVSGCGGEEVPQGAIAKVGSGVVTQAQFDKIIDMAKTQAQQPGAAAFPKKGTTEYNQYAARVVDYLVNLEILDQAAKDMRVTVTDKEVNKRIAQIEEAYGGKKKVDAILKQQGMTRADLKSQMKQQLVSQAIYEKVTKNVKVSDAKLKAYYEKNKSMFNQPETREVRYILIKSSKADAEKVRALLVADSSDANWKKVAKKYSKDPATAKIGGSLGAIQPGQMVPAFEKAAFSLKVNEISEPVKTQWGWHVVEVTKITPASETTYAKAKAQIKSTLLGTAQQDSWTKWLNQRKKDAKIVYAAGYDPTILSKTPSPSASPKASPSPSATK